MKNIAKVVPFFLILILLNGCSEMRNSIKITPEMDKVISQYILEYNQKAYGKTDKEFETHKIYGAAKKNTGTIEVYVYSLYEGFNSKGKEQSGGSLPVLMKIKKVNGTYEVVDYKEAEDGTKWASSVKKMFPRKYANQAFKDTGNVNDLHKQIDQKVNEWLKRK